MTADFDEGSFPKARGWLLAFSSSLIALWFFGADLTSVSVLGTKMEFTRNTEHIWLVALAINAYLLLRFYQHQPDISYSGSGVYKRYYENYMLRIIIWLSKKDIEKEVFELGKRDFPSVFQHAMVKCVIETFEFKRVTEPSEKRSRIRGMKEMVIIWAHCAATGEKMERSEVTPAYRVDRVCPYWVICLCGWLSKLKLWIKTSYATEHLLPYLWSGFAALICLIRWISAIIP
ncbi:hypothetical protein [Pseudomonas guariconensis]|uniref:hypothetical protein n=1 Tax=Pseudomonas guariconensis TaxID=1288410 RepID=UPI00346779B8